MSKDYQYKNQENKETGFDYSLSKVQPKVVPLVQPKVQPAVKPAQYKTKKYVLPEKKLPEDVQAKMENSFGQDFSDVNIHDNSTKAEDLGAKAFAQGKDVHFAPGEFQPNTKEGQELIGHELTHVVQQKEGKVHGGDVNGKDMVNQDPSLEKEADDAGKLASEGKSVEVKGIGSGVQMDPGDPTKMNDQELITETYKISENSTNKRTSNEKNISNIAIERADDNFKTSVGEESFAELISLDINQQIQNYFSAVTLGQKDAIASIENIYKKEAENQKLMWACIGAFLGVLKDFVAIKPEDLTRQFSKVLPETTSAAFATKISTFGNAITRTEIGMVKEFTGIKKELIKAKTLTDPKLKIEDSNKILADSASYASKALLLELSLTAPKKNLNLTGAQRGFLKTQIQNSIMTQVYSNYTNDVDFKNVKGDAKIEFLKNLVIDSGKLSPTLFSGNEVRGNYNKEGAEISNYALEALGGQQGLSDSLLSPYEFAFGTLNSSLKSIGLGINTTKEFIKECISSDKLNQSAILFDIKINDISLFKQFLLEKHTSTDNRYSILSGPMKDVKLANPAITHGVFYPTSVDTFLLDYSATDISNVQLLTSPSDIISNKSGTIKDISSFKLHFNSAGNVLIRQNSINNSSGYDMGADYSGTPKKYVPCNGKNSIRVII
jgi:hypothetical protein